MDTWKRTQGKTGPHTHDFWRAKEIGVWRKTLFFFAGLSLILISSGVRCVSAAPEKFNIERPSTVREAPDFTLKSVEGRSISLSQFKGSIIILNFWATWCRSCANEMPSLNTLYRELKDKGLIVLAVSADRGNPEKVKAFLKKSGLAFPVVLDADGKVRNEYEVYALPFSYLVDKKGRFIGRIVGEVVWDTPDVYSFFNGLLVE